MIDFLFNTCYFIFNKVTCVRRENMFTKNQVLSLLDEYGLTTNEQVVRRWCRNGTLKANATGSKGGYEIEEKSVYELIAKKLQKKLKHSNEYLEGYDKGFKHAKAIYNFGKGDDEMTRTTRDAVDDYYRNLADQEDYIDTDRLMGKYSEYIYSALRQYNPTKYCELGMTEEMYNWIETKNEAMTNEEINRMSQVDFDQSGTILDVAKRRNSKMLEIEEILKDEFVQSLKIEEPVPSIDELF